MVASSSITKLGLIGDNHGEALNAKLGAMRVFVLYLFNYTEFKIVVSENFPRLIRHGYCKMYF